MDIPLHKGPFSAFGETPKEVMEGLLLNVVRDIREHIDYFCNSGANFHTPDSYQNQIVSKVRIACHLARKCQ